MTILAGSGVARGVAVALLAMSIGAGCASMTARPKTARTADGREVRETAGNRPSTPDGYLPPLPGEVPTPPPSTIKAEAPVETEPGLQPIDREAVRQTGDEIGSTPIAPPPIPLELSGGGGEPPPPLPSIPVPQIAPIVPVAPSFAPGTFAGVAPMAPAECANCGGQGRMRGPDAVPPITCPHGGCGAGGCVPGGKPCYQCQAHTFVGRFFANLYECLCCPDPCYQPRWVPEANAAFYVDYARPRTVTRIRWDEAYDLLFPDRSEYFWARDDGKGRGPGPPHAFPKSGSKHPFHPGLKTVQFKGERADHYDQLYAYQEAATARASFFIEYSYRANFPLLTQHTAGFSDLSLGTKALLLDCELLQLTFQFKTFIPTGAPNKGLGTGHVSLEPSLLASVRLASETYFQGQLSEWIPIVGDPTYAGAILHYHMSLNHCLCRLTPDVPLIGTLEGSGWSFQDGAYTDPVFGTQKSSGFTYFSVGPGLRLSVCNNLDFGVGLAFPVTDPHWGNPQIRTELRFLY